MSLDLLLEIHYTLIYEEQKETQAAVLSRADTKITEWLTPTRELEAPGICGMLNFRSTSPGI